jgi:hypothetical protein
MAGGIYTASISYKLQVPAGLLVQGEGLEREIDPGQEEWVRDVRENKKAPV